MAAKNLVHLGISNLCVIGGDGSLTGADLFRQEWPYFMNAFLLEKTFTKEYLRDFDTLKVIGLVGSIDNDFFGTDITIGVDSALHRIVEAIDIIQTTAHSHQRAFVLEVMGRHCGYLALMSGLAANADYIFLPEVPQKVTWRDDILEKIDDIKNLLDKRAIVVIVSEGAVDASGSPIKSSDV